MKKKFLSFTLILTMLVSFVSGFAIVQAAEMEIEAGTDANSAVELDFDVQYVSNIESKDEVDWFKFTTPNVKGFYNIEFGSYTGRSKSLIVCTKSEKELGEVDANNETKHINLSLEPNETYYLKVTPKLTYDNIYEGNYGINIFYKVDSVGDDFDNAMLIQSNKTYTYTIDGSDDVDYFAFNGNVGVEYEFKMTNSEGNTTKYIHVFNNDKAEISNSNVNIGRTGEIKSDKSDIYYIKVRWFAYSALDNKQKHEYSITVKEKVEENNVISPVTPPQEESDVCKHENITEYEHDDKEYGQYSDEEHMVTAMCDRYCDDCDELLKKNANEISYTDVHTYSGNTCKYCGYEKQEEAQKDNNYSKDDEVVIDNSYKKGECFTNSGISYTDVSDSYEYKEAIYKLYELGVVTGYEDGTIRPYADITRAEATKLIVAAMGPDSFKVAQGRYGMDTEFYDVPGSHWASGYVSVGVSEGYINGVGNNMFAPEDNVTYYQMLKMLVCLLGYGDDANVKGGYPYGHYNMAVELGLTEGISFTDDRTLQRGHVFQLVANAVEIPMCINGVYMDGSYGDYKTLITDFHNVFKVRGEFAYLSLDKGEFVVDDSENFVHEKITSSNKKSVRVDLGSIKAGNFINENNNNSAKRVEALIGIDDDFNYYVLFAKII